MKFHKVDYRKGASRAFLLALILFMFSAATSAQGLIKTMLEQIAKLEILLEDTKEGITIVEKGLNAIGEFKKGDFDLHTLFFNSLSNVNPAIKSWNRVADIISMQIQIMSNTAKTLSILTSSRNFTPSDISYISSVFSQLKNYTLKDIDELASILTDGSLQMSDDQRISRIDLLYKSVLEKYTFFQSFSNRALLQANARDHEKLNIQNLGKLY